MVNSLLLEVGIKPSVCGVLNHLSEEFIRQGIEMQQQGDDRYYRDFLCPLFFEGFARRPAERSPEINALLGTVPYLNGGLFLRHQIEERHGEQIAIPDRAFERLFGFFDQYHWHLDDRPLRDDNEINPDVLGYIFEKYINQKQMGAYYTREDITGYISQNTVLPCLFDTARQQCRVAFAGEQSIWRLLRDNPDRYIYPAVRHGSEHELPPEIAAGIDDVTQRTHWNKPAPQEYALPTEIWREVVARRRRYAEVRAKLAAGDISAINDLVTYNLDMRQFAQDVIQQCEGPELLRAFYRAIEQVTVLDPTAGSGAFLFAALEILEPVYDACLERMQGFLDDYDRAPIPGPSPTGGEGKLPSPQRGRGAGGEGTTSGEGKLEVPPALREKMVAVARSLRREATGSEDMLWQALRGKQLDGRKFRRQQPVGAFVLDFYCSSERLAVEVDGAIHENQREADAERQAILESLGIRFVRVTATEVEQDMPTVLAHIRAAFASPVDSPQSVEKGTTPRPSVGEGPGVRGRKYRDFRETLERVGQHPNRHYFIFKSIIVNNLFGVDIMDEAVEICKLRLFLKLVAQIERAEQIEPLPDIDFNIQAGNTLVGFATYAEVQQAIINPQGNAPKLLLTEEEEASLAAIEAQTQDVDRLFQAFRQQQTTLVGAVTPEDKQELRHRLNALNDELNHYLAAEYGVTAPIPGPSPTGGEGKHPSPRRGRGAGGEGAYTQWLATHQPFHWFVEFYGIMQRGGFDVIIGNPPYIGYSKVRRHYTVRGYVTEPCGNLYALTVERAPALLRQGGRCGMIVPIASVSTDSMQALQNLYQSFVQWHSHYAVRPGKLFVGVDMNLTISLFYKTNERKNVYGTGYRRWSSGTTGDRPHIFETLSYVSEPCFTNHVNPHPKLGSSIEKQVLCRMLDHGRKLRAYTTPVGVTLYYHSGGRYWRKALLSKLSSHYKPVTIQSAFAPIVLALLNSQLFYWYWISNSNCMDVVSREVLDLPVFALDTVDPRPFYKLQEELLIAYNTSSTTRVRRGKHIQVEEINFDVHKAKPIIDEIDRALAQHYGFTAEELDFIINYDIKYRMGRDGGMEE
jgi:very-short-patch-repair endonuclease